MRGKPCTPIRSTQINIMTPTLRRTVIADEIVDDDYVVYFDRRRVGRIMLVTERENPAWDWHMNPPLPVASLGSGSKPDLENAKAAFREAWERFCADLTPEDVERWHRTRSGAK
jgi:hypothetical protein